jgi:hypothetical protein
VTLPCNVILSATFDQAMNAFRPFLILILCALAARTVPAADARPNVIVFLVDDMGWLDCGAYGSKY